MNFSAAEYTRQVQEAAAYIKEKLNGRKPEIAITLGSGLGDLAEQLTDADTDSLWGHPHFPYPLSSDTRDSLWWESWKDGKFSACRDASTIMRAMTSSR